MKVQIREGARLEHEGTLYEHPQIVDVGDDAERVKWLQSVSTADPVTMNNSRAGNEEQDNG